MNSHCNAKALAVLRYFSFLVSMTTILSLVACNSSKRSQTNTKPQYQLSIEQSDLFQKSHTGFMLFDPHTQQTLYQHQADKYYIPASNVKILTLYTALSTLEDSIPALRYIIKEDSLIFWGTGDPSFLHPNLSKNEKVFTFLKNRSEQLFYASTNFMDDRYGSGWAWEDYNYAFQSEKSAFPIYGNVVSIEKEAGEAYRIKPDYFADYLQASEQVKGRRIKRVQTNNLYQYKAANSENRSYKNQHPFIYSDSLLIQLLSDTLQRKVQLYARSLLPPSNSTTLYSQHSDSLYIPMMQDSDNFIAEQLLLLSSNQLFDTLKVRRVIRFANDSLFQDLPDKPIWVDGSGLSRYNLLTPRSIVAILDQLYEEIPRKRLLAIFPAGGESGTIAEWYGNAPTTYVYAKTGTLRNNHSLSGYLLTSRGKLLIFSFMHNHFPGGSRPYKQEMEKVLQSIYLNF